ncbi:class Ib ribonucleoside-diphosphate reductase assembly flavoprotein NrdI [Corynebacterium cystitidis]|uniref:class Ib ribonucleoside-diphosphate reductase assembly flavoprotein NrdI n=1 Tax=Corynebacterium cystitidis TaxID=35757 RepID=UPI00211F2C6E|nr:class Ib ribonucleoside-diphosphate reductase assembly flavoprotein NrdI [Corynebacterium cystitidis]
MDVVYFSSVSENTHRFVVKLQEKTQFNAYRIPLRRTEPALYVSQPYILIVPSYGGGDHRGAVPKQVIKFLNVPENRALIRGVIVSGNTNFGVHYCCAGPIIARKCNVPELYRFELLGTHRDVDHVAGLLAAREHVTTST